MKAIWNKQVLAESDETIVVEKNHYFPPESINKEFFSSSELYTICGWKGKASYYHLEVGGERNQNAAWFYPKTKELARNIEGYIAFWRGGKVTP